MSKRLVFESGCSRHIIEVKNYLKDLKPYSNFYVTFGDDSKGKIIGKGKLKYPGLPNLYDVLFVEGFTKNLTSISQPCDQ